MEACPRGVFFSPTPGVRKKEFLSAGFGKLALKSQNTIV